MATDPLREALEKKYHPRHVRKLVSDKANKHALTRREAMLAVARDLNMNWTRYASPEEIASLRNLDTGKPVAAPPPPASTPAPAPRPARARATAAPRRSTTPRRKGPKDRVFVVHGRDRAIRDSMFAFLRAVGLNPVEWGVAMGETGKAMPHIAEVLEAALQGVAAVVVVLTPDDEVVLKDRFQTRHDPEEEKQVIGQARPNVLFEGGMAFGRHPEKTIFVSIGKVKGFTDLGGFHITRLNNTAGKRNELVGKLRTAGADVQTDGREDWYTEGHFELEEDDDGK